MHLRKSSKISAKQASSILRKSLKTHCVLLHPLPASSFSLNASSAMHQKKKNKTLKHFLGPPFKREGLYYCGLVYRESCSPALYRHRRCPFNDHRLTSAVFSRVRCHCVSRPAARTSALVSQTAL